MCIRDSHQTRQHLVDVVNGACANKVEKPLTKGKPAWIPFELFSHPCTGCLEASVIGMANDSYVNTVTSIDKTIILAIVMSNTSEHLGWRTVSYTHLDVYKRQPLLENNAFSNCTLSFVVFLEKPGGVFM